MKDSKSSLQEIVSIVLGSEEMNDSFEENPDKIKEWIQNTPTCVPKLRRKLEDYLRKNPDDLIPLLQWAIVEKKITLK